MAERGAVRGTFVIQIMQTEYATWQGVVNWIEQEKTLPFRSTLELIKLIDDAVDSSKGENGRQRPPPDF